MGMEKKPKIALLNMRYDNNYGGNLQRYAMATILQRMGYSVEYLYIRDNWDDWFTSRSAKKIIKNTIGQIVRHILNPKNEPWLAWHRENDYYRKTCSITEPFLDKYIPHTKPIYSKQSLQRVFNRGEYQAIIAGSDQIWRKQYVERYGLGTWFLDFVPVDYIGKRIVYGASFGVDSLEYNIEDQGLIRPLYKKIAAVSVREKSGLQLLAEYGCKNPQAELVLDPTLLLTKEDYEFLINNADTKPAEGDMFCYVLDNTSAIEEKIRNIAKENNLTPYVVGVQGDNPVSIEQWLRYFKDAKCVFTDSYHGLLFSIIFGKPFHLEYNGLRGNARFDSVVEMLHIDIENPEYSVINEKKEQYKEKSIDFLKNALKQV